MPEHQQIQQSERPGPAFQRRTTSGSQARESNPASIIQRAGINPKSMTPADVLQLQRTIGNRAVGRLLSGVGKASTAQRAPVQRQEIPEEEEPLQGKMAEDIQRQEMPEEEELMQGKFASGLTGTLQAKEEAPPNKTGMPDNLKSGLENLSGLDLSGVRVHYNSSKPAQVNALAYAQGTDIHVAPGQEKHLPHEGWHTVQQMQGRVKPTMKMKGTAVNDDFGLENEADVMGAKALQMQQMIDTNPYMAAQQRHLAMVSSRGPAQPGVTQYYTTLKNLDDDKVYNRSLSGALICGIDYPNHDLYVQDASQINSNNKGASEGMLNFAAGGTKTFNFGFEKSGVDYSKVVPEYKEDQEDMQTRAIEEILAQLSPDSVPTYDETTVTKIVKAKETFRKLAVQWDFKFGDINEDVRQVKSEAIGVYRSLNKYLDGDLDQKVVLDLLHLFKGVILGTVSPSVFDETSLMLEAIGDVVDELITEVGKVFSSDVGKQLRAYLQEQSDFSKTGEIMLPRGCDLVAGTVLGRASRETDENVSVINYNLNKLSNPAHHYATRILSDAIDFATIEGFAKKDYFFFDNTWEFLMHGSRTSFETAFKDYTDTRYSFFESMEGLDLRGGSQAREGAGTGNVALNARGRFGLLKGE